MGIIFIQTNLLKEQISNEKLSTSIYYLSYNNILLLIDVNCFYNKLCSIILNMAKKVF